MADVDIFFGDQSPSVARCNFLKVSVRSTAFVIIVSGMEQRAVEINEDKVASKL
ncbi:hypothetical protein EYZ11_005256 [Aspergillus tanneri]|uniref:Uncharacterized protein n=1 Tax=Aspergillus tanneri TaxID=1220188 RepID=A0A4S3JID1_9EURO|nr:hypothetical protein EYZ11_005256 [Aspergillus tanneri]